ncbi:hypothetical protein AVEN_68747-1 [Araneus ventricosus]|uniref:Uncharacterized protein n=1 Tax=Araneus ventricosus TaxID=182803 RepID=A0A4Y2C6L6_ARAVE|nr:hypothetical protein AVEN_68747-1 [Araneus ventricosus]
MEISNESHLSSVYGENESQIEMRNEKEDLVELMQLKKENLLFEVKTVPHSMKINLLRIVAVNIKVLTAVVWKIIYSNGEMSIKRDSEDKNDENSESEREAMDTSETLINKNGAINDETKFAVENFRL